MSQSQIRWAASHDWFVADLGDDRVRVIDRWVNVNTGAAGDDYLTFGNFVALRNWAGY